MSDPIFERYKEALKAGHVAVLRGRLDEALGHFETAAGIADERPLPHSSVGDVLLRLGRADEAVSAYDRALARSPRDEGALRGRAEALVAAGRTDAAEDSAGELAAAEEPTGAPAPAMGGADDRGLEAVAGGEAAVLLDDDSDAARSAEAPRTPDPAPHLAAAESLLVGGDRAAAATELVAAADAYARLDLIDAALDAANQALRVAPDLPDVHLGLARLYFRRGWRERGTDTLLLLDRFLEIEPLPAAREALAQTAREHVTADPRLAALARGVGGPPDASGA